MSTNVEPRVQHAPMAVPVGLQPFGALPAWLEAAAQPEETALTMLPSLTDPDQARALLEQSIRGGPGTYPDIRIAAATPHVVRYKANDRCTILYHLDYPADLVAERRGPGLVVAKIYH